MDRLTMPTDAAPGLPAAATSATSATPAAAAEVLRFVSESEGVSLDVLRALLTEMGDTVAAFDAAALQATLLSFTMAFKQLATRLNRPFEGDPEVLRLRQAAADELARGRFALADAHLASAEACDLAGLDESETPATRKRLSAAERRAERAAVAQLCSDEDGLREAANHCAEAARIAEPADFDSVDNYVNEQGRTLCTLGLLYRNDGALLEAVDLFEKVIALRERGTDGVSRLFWARAQQHLGHALRYLGGLEGHADRLEDAVAAYRRTLEVFTRERTDYLWASTQNSLAETFHKLGKRENAAALSDKTVAAAHLKEAIAAHHEALKEFNEKRDTVSLVSTQNMLGNVLCDLYDLEADTAHLEEAVAAYGEAEKEIIRESEPFNWAWIRNARGDALFKLGEQDSGTARLEEAVLAYRDALTEYTRERTPQDWASTQISLCKALLSIADRRQDRALAQLTLEQLDAVRPAVAADDVSLAGNCSEVSEKARNLIARLRASS